jgi:hypothetical protein
LSEAQEYADRVKRGKELLKEAESLAAELEAEDKLPVVSNDTRWKPGQSGNPAGRKPGSKNYVTQQRLAMEAALRDYMHTPTRRAKIMKLIDRVLDVGLTGEDKNAVAAAKIIFDKVLGSVKQDDDASSKAPPKVVVVIENATKRPASVKVEDAQYTDTTETTMPTTITRDQASDAANTVPDVTQLPSDQGDYLAAATLEDGNASEKGAKEWHDKQMDE